MTVAYRAHHIILPHPFFLTWYHADEEAEERQAALDAEKAQKEQLRLQEVSQSGPGCTVQGLCSTAHMAGYSTCSGLNREEDQVMEVEEEGQDCSVC